MTKIEWPPPEPDPATIYGLDFTVPYIHPPQRADLKWLAVDLDGTLAESLWTPENPTTQIGLPIWENVFKARKAEKAGYKVAIHTARSWTDYEAIEAWCNHYMVPHRRIVCGKILAAIYLDDKSVHDSSASWIPGGGHCATCRCGEVLE